MAIRLSYSCECGALSDSEILSDAQQHANETGHTVEISGYLTTNVILLDATAIAASAERKARESAIMREARDRGLLPGDKAGVR